MELGLHGKVAIVTGAGRGIGRAIALRLAQEGAILIICTTNVEFLEILLSILSCQSSVGLSLSFLRKQESSIFIGVLDSRFHGSDR